MQCTNHNIPRTLSSIVNLMVATLLLVQPELAMAQFEKVTSGLDTFKAWLWLIIPVAALCIAGVLGLLYSAEVIRKDTLIQWGGGVVFAGAIAGGIIKLFF